MRSILVQSMGRRVLGGVLVACLLPFTTQAAGVDIEVAAELPHPPGNIAVSPDGRIFVSLHSLFDPPIKVMEVRDDGSAVPYPSEAWNTADPSQSDQVLVSVLGVRADAEGRLWMLDNGGRKLVAWDTREEKLDRIIPLSEEVVPEGGFLNDFAVDLTHDAIYVIETGNLVTGRDAALIVVDLETGKARRVLNDHESVIGKDTRPLAVQGKEALAPTGNEGDPFYKPVVGGDPIALSKDDAWLYFGAMSSDTMYRARTEDLRNARLSAEELAQRVERHGDKRFTDGISVDNAGNIYTTSVESNAIGVIDPDGEYRVLVQDDEKLAWPDGMSFGPDGMLYVTVSQIHRAPLLNGGASTAKPPFRVVKLKPLAPGTPGR